MTSKEQANRSHWLDEKRFCKTHGCEWQMPEHGVGVKLGFEKTPEPLMCPIRQIQELRGEIAVWSANEDSIHRTLSNNPCESTLGAAQRVMKEIADAHSAGLHKAMVVIAKARNEHSTDAEITLLANIIAEIRSLNA